MRKFLFSMVVLLPVSLILSGCGNSYPSTGGSKGSGVAYRAFISQNVSSGTTGAGVVIVNAQTDVRPPGVGPMGAGRTPGLMAVTPNRGATVVFSGSNTLGSDNLLTVINNPTETPAAHVTLPGYTESIVIAPDSSAAYIAVPTAPVIGQSPGNIQILSLVSGVISGEIEIPSVRYLSINNGGSRILAFSSNSDSVAVVTPSNLGTTFPTVTYVGGFDRPVQAFFSSDDTTAYVINCGAECGGNEASVQQLDMTTNTPGAPVGVCSSAGPPACAASVGLVDGSTLYLAGSFPNPSPSLACPGETVFTPTCGLLSVFDLNSMTVATAGIVITDGYHNRIALGANGQLFVGAHTCTETAGVSGCLSIYNTLNVAVGAALPGAVLIPPAGGDVTGIEPIAKRQVVYVAQGGELNIYDATIDALEFNPNNPNNPGQISGLIGDFIDVKTIDF